MPQIIDVTTRSGDPAETSADTRVVGIFEDQPSGIDTIDKLVESGEIKAGYKSSGIAHAHGTRFIVVGLGKEADFSPERSRVVGAVAVSAAKGIGAKALSVSGPSNEGEAATAAAFIEGAILKNYVFDAYKSKSDDDDGDDGFIESIEIVTDADIADAVKIGVAAADAANRARDLQNQPSNVATPSYLADRPASIAAEHDLEFDIHDREWIENKKMGAFAAVAKGTAEEPRLIVLRYNGAGASAPTLGFVGKAVTFDTGGISLKPSGKMEEMKFDMSGGAAVLEATAAIAQLGLPVNLISVVPSTENMPGGKATKPGDIVTAYNGKTIEIDNTDAEGRLILADALTYAIELGAERVVNLATLTGAIIVALGHHHAGLFSNNDELAERLADAGKTTHEKLWRMPLGPEYDKMLESKFADMKNIGGRPAGAITGAQFIKRFVRDTPWAHLDIAGTAMGSQQDEINQSWASGFGVRLLDELVRAHYES
jgi:leucyl aminopeptidase